VLSDSSDPKTIEEDKASQHSDSEKNIKSVSCDDLLEEESSSK